MIHHITKIAGFASLCAGYYYVSHHNRVSLENQYLAKMLQFVEQKKPGYSIVVFKLLLNLNLIEKNNKLSQFILRDFDSDGKYIEEVRDLGFRGIQIGPVSFNPSEKDQEDYQIGVKHTLSYICGYRNLYSTQDFQVYLNLVPNIEILKFAPYLIKQNIMQSVYFFSQMQQLAKDKSILNGIVIDYERKNFPLQKTPQTLQLKNDLKKEATTVLQQLNKERKSQIKLQFQQRPYKCMSWQDLLNSIIKNDFTI